MVLILWVILLPIWAGFIVVMGMSGEGAHRSPTAFEALLTLAAYPVLVGTAFVYRRKKPALVWFPILGLVAPFLLLAILDHLR